MAKKCMLDDIPFAGYATNDSGNKIPLCAVHLIVMKQKGMPITMKRGMPDLPDVDPDEPHEWRRVNLGGDNIWKCDRCDLESKQNPAPSSYAFGGCATKPVEWAGHDYPMNLKWRT